MSSVEKARILGHCVGCSNSQCKIPLCNELKKYLNHMQVCTKENCPQCGLMKKAKTIHLQICSDINCEIKECKEVYIYIIIIISIKSIFNKY